MNIAFRGRLNFCSNFYSARCIYDGMEYPSSEHAFQAAKTLDMQVRREICAMSAAKAKEYGRRVDIRTDWEDIKLSVMYEVLKSKFSNPRLKQLLIDTGDEELVEVNYWGDKFWGQCPAGVGDNHLGKILMKLRGELNENN